MDKQKILKAGEIAKQVKKFIKPLIKKDKPLLEIAEAIEDKIISLGGKPAFPTNLCINDIAAHYTPSHEDKTKAHGLLKIDLGVHIDGWISDTAFSVDLENSEENKKMIQANEDALESAIEFIKNSQSKFVNDNKKIPGGGRATPSQIGEGPTLRTSEIGKEIQKTIESQGFSPITNLTGHSINQYELHSGISIPNIKDSREIKIENGLYAIEPFATSGNGKVYDGKSSGIYYLIERKPIRSPIAREVLDFIEDEYATLPFCSRWLVKKFGTRALFTLKQLEQAKILHHFPQLVETSHKPVSQAEHTILISEKSVEVTT